MWCPPASFTALKTSLCPMKISARIALVILLPFVHLPLHAEKNAELKPLIAKAGKVVIEEDFSTTKELAKPWSIAKGDWQVKDGVLAGKEKASDKHAAVLMLAKPNKDSIVQLSFKLDGAKAFDLSFNTLKGHLFRVTVANDGLSLNKDRDKKDPKSKVEVMGKAAVKFEKGKWFTMLVEVKGDKVSVKTDNGVNVQGSGTGLAAEKTGYRFVARGEALSLDDLKVWEAE